MNEEAVLARARAAGVAVDWTDAMGRPQRVRTELLRRLLEVARRHRCADRRAAAGHRAPRPADRDRRHRCRPSGRAGAGRRRGEVRRHPRRHAARHRAAGLSPPALRRSRDHPGRRAVALRHPAGHRRRRADVGRGGAGLQPAPRRRWRHRRRRRRARSCRGGGPSRRRRRGAQPRAQPVPARSGALRPLLAVEPAVPQSALRRSRGHLRCRRRRCRRGLGARGLDRLGRRRRRQVRPPARPVRRVRPGRHAAAARVRAFVVEGGEALAPARPLRGRAGGRLRALSPLPAMDHGALLRRRAAGGQGGRHAHRPDQRPRDRHGPRRQPCLGAPVRPADGPVDRRAARCLQSARPGLGPDRLLAAAPWWPRASSPSSPPCAPPSPMPAACASTTSWA